jgi:hypothetical protein
MTITHHGLRTFAVAAAMAVAVASASAQTPEYPHGQKYVGPVHAAPASDVGARLASLDARIMVLRADMMMFVGELKIQAMASLIDALVERQALTDHDRRRMMMRPDADDRVTPDPEPEMEPEKMCSPWI